MRVSSFLLRGDGAALGSKLNALASKNALNVLVLMSLGVDHSRLLDAAAGLDCPVYVTEAYGIIGFEEEAGRSVELMEEGRGSEYGFQGGSGGQGCLVLGYSGDVRAGHDASFPKDASSLLVVADTSKAFGAVAEGAPLHYGGISKEAYVRAPDGASLQRVPFFWVASPVESEPIGVSTFTEDAGGAAASLMGQMPAGWRPSAVGLFPCFTRGVNLCAL